MGVGQWVFGGSGIASAAPQSSGWPAEMSFAGMPKTFGRLHLWRLAAPCLKQGSTVKQLYPELRACCGSSCQEAHKSFDECSARCYPQSPSGKEAMFVPPSVRAASMAAQYALSLQA
eukprot:g33096.t1